MLHHSIICYKIQNLKISPLNYMFYVFLTSIPIFMLIMQSKNGGLSAWEPAGAQEWLEVSTLTYWTVVEMFIWKFMQIYSLLIIIFQWRINYLFFPSSGLIPQNSSKVLSLSMSMLSALHHQSKLYFCLRSCTLSTGKRRLRIQFKKQSNTF